MCTGNGKSINGDWWVRYPYFKDEFSMDRISDEGWWNNSGRRELNDEQTTPGEVSAPRGINQVSISQNDDLLSA